MKKTGIFLIGLALLMGGCAKAGQTVTSGEGNVREYLAEAEGAALGKAEACQHELTEVWGEEPTCTFEGAGHALVCSRCGYREELENRALGHQPDQGAVWKPADCCHEGYVAHVCVRCGINLPDTMIPPDPDAHIWHEDKEGWYCGLCSAVRGDGL